MGDEGLLLGAKGFLVRVAEKPHEITGRGAVAQGHGHHMPHAQARQELGIDRRPLEGSGVEVFVVPPHAASLACQMDGMRMSWGV